jgi:hypothetical protein
MDEKFTPGPWRVVQSKDNSGNLGICAPNVRNVIAEIFAALRYPTEKTPQAISNAHLIAAAPDLFQVVSVLIGSLNFDRDDPVNAEILRRAHTAIAKARGES